VLAHRSRGDGAARAGCDLPLASAVRRDNCKVNTRRSTWQLSLIDSRAPSPQVARRAMGKRPLAERKGAMAESDGGHRTLTDRPPEMSKGEGFEPGSTTGIIANSLDGTPQAAPLSFAKEARRFLGPN
jgi:hypothetical protein